MHKHCVYTFLSSKSVKLHDYESIIVEFIHTKKHPTSLEGSCESLELG